MPLPINDRDASLLSPRLIATSVTISANGGSFLKGKNGGVVVPTDITLTANLTVFTSATVSWSYAISTAPDTWVSLGTGTTKVITGSTIHALLGDARSVEYRAEATQAGFLTSSNTFTVTYSEEVSDPIEIFINRPSVTVPVDALGDYTDLANTSTVISVKRGTDNLTYNESSGPNTFYIATSGSDVSISPGGGITLGTFTGSGTTASYANITNIVDGLITMSVEVTYYIKIRDASGNLLTPSTPYSVTQTFTKLASGSGTSGIDAYHIRLDNEARFVVYEFTGEPKAGLPINATTYVTKGGVTLNPAYITYTKGIDSGTITATVNSSTGAITVTDITADINYVQVIGTIVDPELEEPYDIKKTLYVYKIKDGALTIELNISTVPEYPAFAFASSTDTVHTEGSTSLILFTASLTGIPAGPTVTWSARAFDIDGNVLSGAGTLLSTNGNTASMTVEQFGARGNPSTRTVEVTASYNTGLGTVMDSVQVVRVDDLSRYVISSILNSHITFIESAQGTLTEEQLQETSLVQVFDTFTLDWDPDNWTITATPPAGTTVTLNGSSVPTLITGIGGAILRVTAVASGYSYYVIGDLTTIYRINLTATKGENTAKGSITYAISQSGSTGVVFAAYPAEIVLPVDSNGNILSYENAFSMLSVTEGGIDVTQTGGWTITKVDGPGVTSELSYVAP